jgi:hypothetical protein
MTPEQLKAQLPEINKHITESLPVPLFDTKKLYTVNELAKIYNIDKSCIRKHIIINNIKHIKIELINTGFRRLFQATDFIDYKPTRRYSKTKVKIQNESSDVFTHSILDLAKLYNILPSQVRSFAVNRKFKYALKLSKRRPGYGNIKYYKPSDFTFIKLKPNLRKFKNYYYKKVKEPEIKIQKTSFIDKLKFLFSF